MPVYQVIMHRTEFHTATVELEAATEEEAKKEAMDLDLDVFENVDANQVVVSITQVEEQA